MVYLLKLSVFALSIVPFALKSASIADLARSLPVFQCCTHRKTSIESRASKEDRMASEGFKIDKLQQEEVEFFENLYLLSGKRFINEEDLKNPKKLKDLIPALLIARKELIEQNRETINIKSKKLICDGRGLSLIKSKEKINHFQIIATDIPGFNLLKEIQSRQKWLDEIINQPPASKTKRPIFKVTDNGDILIIFDRKELEEKQIKILEDCFGGEYLEEENRFENEIPKDKLPESGFNLSFSSSAFKIDKERKINLLDDKLLEELEKQIDHQNSNKIRNEMLEEKMYMQIFSQEDEKEEKHRSHPIRLAKCILSILSENISFSQNQIPTSYLSDEFKEIIINSLESQAILGCKCCSDGNRYPIKLPIWFWKLLSMTPYSDNLANHGFTIAGTVLPDEILSYNTYNTFKDFILSKQILMDFIGKPLHFLYIDNPYKFYDVLDRKSISKLCLSFIGENCFQIPEDFLEDFRKMSLEKQIHYSQQKADFMKNLQNDLLKNNDHNFYMYNILIVLFFQTRDLLRDLKLIEDRLLEVNNNSEDYIFLEEIKKRTIKLLKHQIEDYSQHIYIGEEYLEEKHLKLKGLFVKLLPEISAVID